MADQTPFHGRHEVELVAAHAAGEATGAEAIRAQDLIDACDACFDLARDLRAITLHVQSLPSAARVATTQTAPRDFRLTPEQAERLLPGSPVARLGSRVGAALASFGRPLGASMATLGVAGLLIGTLTLGAGGAGFAGSGESLTLQSATGAPNAGGENPEGPAPQATSTLDRTAIGPAVTEIPKDGGPAAADSGAIARDASGASAWLFLGSAVLLIVGLGLIVVATRGRSGQGAPREQP